MESYQHDSPMEINRSYDAIPGWSFWPSWPRTAWEAHPRMGRQTHPSPSHRRTAWETNPRIAQDDTRDDRGARDRTRRSTGLHRVERKVTHDGAGLHRIARHGAHGIICSTLLHPMCHPTPSHRHRYRRATFRCGVWRRPGRAERDEGGAGPRNPIALWAPTVSRRFGGG